MTKDDFVKAFYDAVCSPAQDRGYRFVRKSQTLAYDAAELTVYLVRLGGRMAVPGAITHVLCARHRFLRELDNLEIPDGDADDPLHCPYKFAPSELVGLAPAAWTYRPRHLNYGYDRLRFADEDESTVHDRLEDLAHLLTGPVVQWAGTLTPQKALRELRARSSDAWCERIWIEDYESHLV
jgi:hypothetical protein